ncbi:MAG: hypothetical protein Q8R17_01025, partial [bacterium]|nr:hypothetical protein [bacterium]
FINKIGENILNPLIYLMFGVASLTFAWGVYVFLTNLNNEEELKKGGMAMLWGVLGMAIMLGAKGIVRVICGTIGVACPPL